MADAIALRAIIRKGVGVQVPLVLPILKYIRMKEDIHTQMYRWFIYGLLMVIGLLIFAGVSSISEHDKNTLMYMFILHN
jgi:hypothetical protein